jgi:hypothetical protein
MNIMSTLCCLSGACSTLSPNGSFLRFSHPVITSNSGKADPTVPSKSDRAFLVIWGRDARLSIGSTVPPLLRLEASPCSKVLGRTLVRGLLHLKANVSYLRSKLKRLTRLPFSQLFCCSASIIIGTYVCYSASRLETRNEGADPTLRTYTKGDY